MRPSLVLTAILAREPGSRAAPLISDHFFSDFRYFNAEQFNQHLWCTERDSISCGPRPSVGNVIQQSSHMSFPCGKFSRGSTCDPCAARLQHCCPRSTIILSRVVFFTVPLTRSPSLSRYCFNHLGTLSFAHFLNNNLLGCLSSNPSKRQQTQPALPRLPPISRDFHPFPYPHPG